MMGSYIFGISRNSLLRSITVRLAVRRSYGDEPVDTGSKKKGVVVGIRNDPETNGIKFTDAAQHINDMTFGKLEEQLKESKEKEGKEFKLGQTSLFESFDTEFSSIVVVSLGNEGAGFDALENLEEGNENARIGAAAGCKRLQEQGVEQIHIEGLGNPEAAAEGAALSIWRYQDNKNTEHQIPIPSLHFYFDEDANSWQRGLFKAESQNLARRLSDTPANLMTPSIFAQNASDALCPCGISVEVKNREWLESRNMNAILAIARGSSEQPLLLELTYSGGPQEEKPIALVGKGVTFDSGGLCLKECKEMSEYRADMAGAAVVVAVMKAAAALSLPLNISAAIPLCENMTSGMAIRPGDVVRAMNGKTIRVDDTDNEGRVILADALSYAQSAFRPKLLIDIATLTVSMRRALGCSATGVFTNSLDMWDILSKAGSITGDRVWLFPLWETFKEKVTQIPSADVTNVGYGPGGDPCRAAAFLREFVTCLDWIHMDITGSGMLSHYLCSPYMTPGRMSGRPTRTLIHFLYLLACRKNEAA